MFLKALRLLVVTLTANVRFKLRVIKMENEEEKNTSKQFLWIKLGRKYYFLVEVIDEKKEKPWSRGTNSRLPPSLSSDQPENADPVFAQNTSALVG